MNPWLVTTFAGVGLVSAYHHGVTVTDHKWQALWAGEEASRSEGRAVALNDARVEEQRRHGAANEVAIDARNQNEAVALDAADADRAGERLHHDATQLVSGSGSCTSDSGAAERGQAASRAAMVLSDLLKRADQRAGELAQAYDRARISGLACQRVYENLHKW